MAGGTLENDHAREEASERLRQRREPPKLIVVLGMHRSGTSAATRGLEALGVSLGSSLMPGVAGDNDKGFFEDTDIQKFNDRVLKKLGGSWDSLEPINPQTLTSAAFTEERREAGAILRGKLGERPFAFKDPRTALLLPLWQCVFQDLELDERYLFVVRNPLEVAASLQARNRMAPTRALLLWAKYNFSAESNSRDRPRCLISYERLLTEPRASLRRIADMLGLQHPGAESSSIDTYSSDFLSLALRRNHLSRHELKRSGQAPDFVVGLFDQLLASASGGHTELDHRAYDELLRAYDAAAPLIAHMERTELERRRLSQELTATAKRLEEACQTIVAQDQNLQRQADEQKALVGSLTHNRDDLQQAQTDLVAARHALEGNAQQALELDGLKRRCAELAAKLQLGTDHTPTTTIQSAIDAHAMSLEQVDRLHSEATALRAALETALREQETAARHALEGSAQQAMELDVLKRRCAELAAKLQLGTDHTPTTTIQSAIDAHAMLLEQVDRLHSEATALRAALETALREQETAARQLADLSLRREQDRVEMVALNATLLATTEAAQALEDNAGLLRASLATKDSTIARLTREVEALTTEGPTRRQLAEEISALQVNLSSATSLVEDVRRQNATLTDALTMQESVSAGLVQQIEALILENTRSADAAARLESEVQRLHRTLADSHAERAKLEQGTAARVAELERNLDDERTHSRAQLDSLRRFSDGAKADIEALRAQLDAQRRQTDEASAALRQANVDRGSVADASDAERASELEQLQQELQEARAEGARCRQAARVHEAASGGLRRDLLLARASLSAFQRSTSWRLTRPLRAVVRAVRNPKVTLKAIARRVARWGWHSLVPARYRARIGAALFSSLPFAFKNTNAYQRWQTARAPLNTREAPSIAYTAVEGYVPLQATQAPSALKARAIAFYLPQFHPIPENNAWWGEGFTEWTKVRAATPRFPGHYQPHVPGDLGYYDLLADNDILKRQSKLAKLHGVSGFCFYFYWFAGKRLLEAPIQRYLETPEAETEFCLCWANENWTRRWDGKDNEVLIAQDHSPADDLAFIAHVSSYFRDPRYIKVDGRPLLIVYRPDLLPSASSTAQRWRDWLRQNGFGEVYLAYTQSFENAPPARYGFDAAIEFPPNNMGLDKRPAPQDIAGESKAINFYDWTDLSERSRRYSDPGYKLFRGVTPSWDNTARRPRDGAVLLNSSPSIYQAWLARAAEDAQARFASSDERLVFINAWNEWAEGAHLEPDRRHGYAWLSATRAALESQATDNRKIIVVTHDLHRHGAQYNALAMVKTLRTSFGYEVVTIAGGDGDLANDFRAVGELITLPRGRVRPEVVESVTAHLAERGFRQAIVNSAASAWLAPYFARHEVRMVGLVHELPSILSSMELGADLRTLDGLAESLVFPTQGVLEANQRALQLPRWRRGSVIPQGLYKGRALSDLNAKDAARVQLANRLALPSNARFVLGVGFADKRKGPDIFVDWAVAAIARWPDLHFVWVGAVCPNMRPTLDAKLAKAGPAGKQIHFVGFVENNEEFYAAASIYALSSREDPFPSTALEALAHGTPVITVRGRGGIEELSTHNCVVAIDDSEPQRFVTSAARWLDDKPAHAKASLEGRDLTRREFGFTTYVGRLLEKLDDDQRAVSAVVPNYNYARYLRQRLCSILSQSVPPREIVVLDDQSTDDSLTVIEEVLCDSSINWRVIRNEANSGNVFAQWRKGVEQARDSLVWIAEADDWAAPDFLKVTAAAFANKEVALSYSQSKQVDDGGNILAPHYLDYVSDVSLTRWTTDYVATGEREVAEGLSVKNTIPNVSAVLFRREALLGVLQRHFDEVSSYRVAGDWCVYVNALRHGGAAFSAQALNYHRRHSSSVTISKFGLSELAEIARMQGYVAAHFGVDAEARAKGTKYLQRLVDEFGLAHRYAAAELAAAMAKAGAPPN